MAKTAVATKVKPVVRPRTTEAPADNFDKAKRCLKIFGEAWFEFDQTVADIYTSEEWKDRGYDKFEKCAQEEWGMNYRTAMNHVNVGMAIKKFGITLERAEEIGWTNFMEISSLFKTDMTKGQIDSYIKKAAKMTHEEVVRFKQEVKHGITGGTKTTQVTMIFKLLNEQAEVVQAALNACKELAQTEYDDAALEYICTEWMASHDPDNVDEIKAQLKADLGDEEGAEEVEEEAPKKKAARKERVDKGKTKKNGKKAKKDEEGEDDIVVEPGSITGESDDDDLLGD